MGVAESKTEDIANNNRAKGDPATARRDGGESATCHPGYGTTEQPYYTGEELGRGKQHTWESTSQKHQKGWHPARGLLYRRKKVTIKHDRGLIAWMKAGKSGGMKLAVGSRP